VRGEREAANLRIRENSYHNPVKKYEMRRAFSQQSKSEETDAGSQMSHGDFFWRKKLSQKIIANPQSETYSASISINRPFL